MDGNRTFGDYLTAKMRERGFKSDEQLARKAMVIQRRLSARINIQRRTINNWRNDKARPRSINDPQFELVALALGLGDRDMEHVERLIDSDFANENTTNGKDAKPLHQSPSLASKPWSWMSWKPVLGLVIVAVALPMLYIGLKENQTNTILQTIPPTQLRVSETGFVIPNSATEVVSDRLLQSLTSWELYVARNEIFARNGRPFVKKRSICLQNHFDSWAKSQLNPDGWYVKRSGAIQLTDLEYRNAETIRNFECKVRGGQYNCSGKLTECQ
ncbi:MAG: YARHG domain-containing protein [Rhizobiaceae bacterium]|nr:YARHG domain-containing protein [Rhizobiaceae bacterium]